MRFVIAAAALVLIAGSAQADTMANCAGAWHKMPAADKDKTNYAEHMQTCMAPGYVLPTSDIDKKPSGATGQCRDGTYTKAKTREKACSGHSGVAQWF